MISRSRDRRYQRGGFNIIRRGAPYLRDDILRQRRLRPSQVGVAGANGNSQVIRRVRRPKDGFTSVYRVLRDVDRLKVLARAFLPERDCNRRSVGVLPRHHPVHAGNPLEVEIYRVPHRKL